LLECTQVRSMSFVYAGIDQINLIKHKEMTFVSYEFEIRKSLALEIIEETLKAKESTS